MCFFWRDKYIKSPEEPTLNEWYNFLDHLVYLKDNKLEINLAGGEPLADERNLALVRFASQKSFYTSLNSSGFLIDKEMAYKIADSGLNLAVISLDSINKNTHDFLRGVDGSYDRVMRAISYLDKCSRNLEIWILAIILEKNLDDIIRLAEWVNAHDRIRRILFQAIAQPFNTPFVDEWHNKSEYNFLWPQDIKKVHEVIDELIRLKKAGYKITNTVSQFETFKRYFQRPSDFIKKTRCNVDFYMNINNLGDVYMCIRRGSIGNIKKDDPDDIWYSEAANRVREEIKNCQINCHHLINCCYEEEQSFYKQSDSKA
jgi:MoaA/NifB/PqqE/SkfB family radical SAM enzyme